MFGGDVPCLAIQFGQPPNGDIDGLCKIIQTGTDVLVLDSRPREVFGEVTKDGMLIPRQDRVVSLTNRSRKITVKEALNAFERWTRNMWLRGATDEHLAATLAHFNTIICDRFHDSTSVRSTGEQV